MLAAALLASFVIVPQDPELARLQAVPFTAVRIADTWFAPRRATNRRITLQHALAQLEATGTLGNFDLAAAGKRDGFKGYVFQDSDAYKAVEAIAYALGDERDAALEAQLDTVIARIAAAQQPDGYLNSWYTVHGQPRFTNLRDNHELYCAGHLFEAAVAHWQATGRTSLLDVATRYADLLCATFGTGDGRRPGYPGHPETELALIKLGRATGKSAYTDLARYFIDARGSHFYATEHGTPAASYDGTYWLDHVPVRELRAIAGHAVRAGYLLAGATDVAAERDDPALRRALRRVWRNAAERNSFVTGGLGPSGSNEGFTHDYDLPTESAYQETCASIAMALWSHRMNLLFGEGVYADAVETALYNAVLAGVQLDGTRFFYVNPLASRGDHHRAEWFGCACCPPNVARTLAALGGYAYASGAGGVWVNLYIQGAVRTTVGADELALNMTTSYPWSGHVQITVHCRAPVATALHLRQPGWCAAATLSLGGTRIAAPNQRGYLVVARTWRDGDVLDLELDMPVRRVEADPRAVALRGMTALARGPLVYCVEQCDQPVPLERIAVPAEIEFAPHAQPDLLGGITVLRGEGIDGGERAWAGGLYRTVPAPRRVPLQAIPYAVWDNRAAGAMRVWLPTALPLPFVVGPEHGAELTMSFVASNCAPEGIRDGDEPRSSGEQPSRLCHWWNHKGSTEWVQYTWPRPRAINGVRVYWFDDTGRGECRLPNAARLLVRETDSAPWRAVRPLDATGLPIALDRWCELRFEPVTAAALRLEVDLQAGWAAGVHEWQVLAADDS